MSCHSDPPNCCTFCFRFILLLGFSFLITFIVYRTTTKGPRLYLFDIRTTAPSANITPSITCQIELKNRARYLGVYYDDLLVSVTYPPFGPETYGVVPAFYQGFHKRAFKDVTLHGAPWVVAKAAASKATNWTAVLLRVRVDTEFRYKAAATWKSERYELTVSEDVQVNADGKMIAPYHIHLPLSSAAYRWTGKSLASWAAFATTGTTALLAWLYTI